MNYYTIGVIWFHYYHEHNTCTQHLYSIAEMLMANYVYINQGSAVNLITQEFSDVEDPTPEQFWEFLWRNPNPKAWLVNPRTQNSDYSTVFQSLELVSITFLSWNWTFWSWKHQPQNIFPTPEQIFRICSAVGKKLRQAPDTNDHDLNILMLVSIKELRSSMAVWL